MLDQQIYQQKFSLSIRDINYANHLDHLALLNYLHETRVRFLREQGYSELDVDGAGSGLVVAELQCNYRSECFYGQEIQVGLELVKLSPTRLVFSYRVIRDDELSAKPMLVATAAIRVAFLSRQRKVIPIPAYLSAIARIETNE